MIDQVKARARRKRWELKHPVKFLEYKRRKAIKNRAKLLAKSKVYREKNKEKCNARVATSHRKRMSDPIQREQYLESIRTYVKNRKATDPIYKATIRENQKRWEKKQRLENPSFKVLSNLRRRLWRALNRKVKKSAKTTQLLGCSTDDLMIYLESRFQPGMTWENYGSVWHLDHIVPCVVFDLSKPEHQRACFHFSNLQPLFAEQNLRKARSLFRIEQST